MHLCALALAMLLVPVVSAQWLQEPQWPAASSSSGFDPANAVRHVRSANSTPRALVPSVRDADDFMIDTSCVYVPDICTNEAGDCAFDGTNFLVVWTWHDVHGEQLGINCARVTPQGELVDAVCIAISRGDYWNDDLGHVAVAFDGSNYLVAWRESRNGTYDYDIRGARITPAGVVLDTQGFLISGAENDQWHPSIAFDGTDFLVVWQDARDSDNHYDIYGARVTPAGVVLDTAGIAVSAAANNQEAPRLVFDGVNFLVVWQDYRNGYYSDIYGARVSREGLVLDSSGLAISTATSYQWDPHVASDGTSFFVCWDDLRDGLNAEDVYGARVTPDGIVLDTAGLVVTDADDNQGGSSLLFDGTNYLVVWTDERHGVGIRDVYGARVAPDGLVRDTSGLVISAAAVHPGGPVLAFDGANSLVAWSDLSTGSGSALYGSRVTPAGNVLDTLHFCLTPCAGYQQWPAVALGGTNYLVAWADLSDFAVPNILCARVTPAGEVLDQRGLKISTATGLQGEVSVAFDGTNFLVVWDAYRSGTAGDVFGARVTPEGEVLDTAGFSISVASNQCGSRVAFDGTNYLVIWTAVSSDLGDIYATRVTPDGVVLDTAGIAISTAANEQSMPAVVSDGTGFLVLWTDYRNGQYSDIYGARVTADGVVLDTAGIPVSTAAYYQMRPAAVFDGNDFFVVWEENRGGGAPDIYAARVTPAGVVLDSAGIPVSTATGDQWYSTVAFDGTDLIVAWMDFRASDFSDIYGARVSPDGVVLDSFVIVARDRTQSKPALARGGNGSMLLVYVDRTERAGGKTYVSDRIWGNLVQRPSVVEDGASDLHRRAAMATVVRGVMVLDAAGGRRSTGSRAELLDISGRKVLDLLPGANDVRALAPGVYFVREAQAQAQAQAVRKVIVTR
jgi:hypothetical protein